MIEINKKHYWIVGLAVTLISFLLLFIGVKVVLKNDVSLQNIIAYAILSLIFGGVSSSFYYLKAKIGLLIFILGLLIGFFEMYRTLLTNNDGWGDLTGFIALFFLAAIGFFSGIAVQLSIFLYKKITAHKKS